MSAHVLIADDDPFLRELLAHKLSAAGYSVSSARHGGEALEQCRSSLPDLIVLDAMMPVTDGFEVLRRLKSDPLTAAVPVIMLTAMKREEDVVGALKLGAADYLVKPFIPDELVARIGRLLPTGTDHANTPDDRGSGLSRAN
ncbi:MAG TPA: response regulator [Brevundimonas sp.]|jgi:DNA-binding response OmpR family regulator